MFDPIAVLNLLSKLATLVFVVSSMLALGLSLTVKQILAPLRDRRLVLLALIANFVFVPIVAFLLKTVLGLDPSLGIGLMLLATSAGAPLLPKLTEIAKADVALSVGLMGLLMIVTVIYVPVVLPLLLPGVSVNPVSIGRSLVVLMLIPLAIGLFIKARYAEIAAKLKPHIAQASSTSLIAVFVLMLTLNYENIIGVIGSRAILAAVLLIVMGLAIGYYLAPTKQSRSVMGLGTAERNIAAAMVVADGNFRNDPNVLTMILVGALLMLSMMMLVAGEFGKRVQPSETE